MIEMFATGLLCGVFLGALIGVCVMCLIAVANAADDGLELDDGQGDERQRNNRHEP